MANSSTQRKFAYTSRRKNKTSSPKTERSMRLSKPAPRSGSHLVPGSSRSPALRNSASWAVSRSRREGVIASPVPIREVALANQLLTDGYRPGGGVPGRAPWLAHRADS